MDGRCAIAFLLRPLYITTFANKVNIKSAFFNYFEIIEGKFTYLCARFQILARSNFF